SGSNATLDFGLRLALWFGHTRAYAGAGVGFEQCSLAVCKPLSDGDGPSGLGIPLEVGVDTLGVHLGHARFVGDMHLGVGVRYRVTPTLLPTYAGEQWHAYHGIYVVPWVSFGAVHDPAAPGVPGGFRVLGSEVDFPIGILAPFPNPNSLAVTIGGAVAFG